MSDEIKVASLEVEAEAKTDGASRALESLASSLEKLKKAVSGSNLANLNSQLERLNKAVQGTSANAEKMKALASAVRSLSTVTLSGGTLGAELTRVREAAERLSATDTAGLARLSAALAQMHAPKGLPATIKALSAIPDLVSQLNGADLEAFCNSAEKLSAILQTLGNVNTPGFNAAVSALRSIPQTASELNGADLEASSARINRLAGSVQTLSATSTTSISQTATGLQNVSQAASSVQSTGIDRLREKVASLASRVPRLSSALNSGNTSINRFSRSARNASSSVNAMGNSVRMAGNKVWAFIGRLTLTQVLFSKAFSFLKSAVGSANEYVEDLNLFTASMGGYAAEAKKYAETVGEIMGIDPSEWMRGQGTLQTIATGFGVASNRAAVMSKNLTQLSYDLSSFFNIPVAQAMQKIQSGIAGESEPLRALGYDLSVARLQQEAYRLGIQKKVSAMSQAEKAELRYYTIMTQVTTAHGDMARTIKAPANQLRVLTAQLKLAGRALGNIFIPLLNAVLPYLIVALKLVRKLADAIARLFHFELPEVDYSGISAEPINDAMGATDGFADSLGDAGSAAKKTAEQLKKLKNNTLGIDELNILTQPDDSTNDLEDATASTNGAGLGITLPEYNFMEGLEEKLETNTDKIFEILDRAKDRWDVWFGAAELLVGAILVFSGASIPLGLALMVMGAMHIAKGIMQEGGFSQEIIDKLDTLRLAAEGAAIAIGVILILTGANVPLGLGLIVVGAVGLAAEVALGWNNMSDEVKQKLADMLFLASAAVLVLGMILAFSGANIPLGIALMIAGAVGLATAIKLRNELLPAETEKSKDKLKLIIAGGLVVLGFLLLALAGPAFAPLALGLIIAGAYIFGTTDAVQNNAWLNDMLTGKFKDLIFLCAWAAVVIGVVLLATGNFIMGIALIVMGAAVLGAVTEANGGWDFIKEVLTGPLSDVIDFLIEVAAVLGAILLCTGNIPLGIALLVIGAGTLGAQIEAYGGTGFLKEFLSGRFNPVIELGAILLLIVGLLLCVSGNILGGIGLVTGGLSVLAAAEKASGGKGFISDFFKGEFANVLRLGAIVSFIVGMLFLCTGVLIPLGFGLVLAGISVLGVDEAVNGHDSYMYQLLHGETGKVIAIGEVLMVVVGLLLLCTGVVMLGLGLLMVGASALWSQYQADEDGTGLKKWIGDIVEGTVSFLKKAGMLLFGVLLILFLPTVPLGFALISEAVGSFTQGRGYPVGLYAKASEARAAAEIYRRDVILPYIRDPLDGLVKLDNDKYDMYFRGEKIGETCYTLEQARNARFLLTAQKIGEETGKIE